MRGPVNYISRRGHNWRISCHRLFVIDPAIIAALIAHAASAQNCDDRYPWTCRGFVPSPQSIRPGARLSPTEIAPNLRPTERTVPARPGEMAWTVSPALRSQYAALYAPVDNERFPIPAVELSDIKPEYLRKAVFYPTQEQPGTIIIDPHNHFLYLIQGGGRAGPRRNREGRLGAEDAAGVAARLSRGQPRTRSRRSAEAVSNRPDRATLRRHSGRRVGIP
jgi:lipoprotein-anchoring transpeptidase ErfK/SrfK